MYCDLDQLIVSLTNEPGRGRGFRSKSNSVCRSEQEGGRNAHAGIGPRVQKKSPKNPLCVAAEDDGARDQRPRDCHGNLVIRRELCAIGYDCRLAMRQAMGRPVVFPRRVVAWVGGMR